jgi:hypothetical protein
MKIDSVCVSCKENEQFLMHTTQFMPGGKNCANLTIVTPSRMRECLSDFSNFWDCATEN